MKILYILIILSLSPTILAQHTADKQNPNSHIIECVLVRGNRRIKQSGIKSWIGTHKGGTYNREQLDSDIRALYDTGHFDDIKVFVETGERGGQIVTFEVSDRLLITEIVYEGIDPTQVSEISEELNKQKAELLNGSEYDPVKVRQAAKIIQGLLFSRGYQEVKINPLVERKTATDVLINFKIDLNGSK